MCQAIVRLLGHAWSRLVASLGTTTLAIIIFSMAVPVVTFLVVLIFRARRDKRAGTSTKKVLLGSLRSPQTIVAGSVSLLAWVALYGWAVIATIYKDHCDLGRGLSLAVAEKNDALNKIDGLQQQISQLREQLGEAKRRSSPSPNGNQQLRERTFLLSGKIRKLSGGEKNQDLEMMRRDWSAISGTGILTTGTDQEKQEYRNRSAREREQIFRSYVRKYHDSYMVDALAIRESLLRRLPPGIRDDSAIASYKNGFGSDDLDKIADDLEKLAGMIRAN